MCSLLLVGQSFFLLVCVLSVQFRIGSDFPGCFSLFSFDFFLAIVTHRSLVVLS